MFSGEIAHNGKSLISAFEELPVSTNKTLIMAASLSTRLSFPGVKKNSWYLLISWDPRSYVVRQLVRQLVYTMFVRNNRASFHLRWKKNLVNHGKVPKYCETDCLQNFVLISMLLLRGKIVKNSHIKAEFFFIFLKSILKQTWNSLSAKLQTQWRDRENNYQGRIIFRLFSHIIAQILSLNNVKVFRVPKNIKEIKFQGVLEQLISKKISKDNNSSIISSELLFSCEIEPNEKSLISVFQEFSASTNNSLNLTRSLGTRLSFHEF